MATDTQLVCFTHKELTNRSERFISSMRQKRKQFQVFYNLIQRELTVGFSSCSFIILLEDIKKEKKSDYYSSIIRRKKEGEQVSSTSYYCPLAEHHNKACY